MVFHALEAVKEDEKGRSTVVERTQYITRQKFFWIFCNLSLTFSRSCCLGIQKLCFDDIQTQPAAGRLAEPVDNLIDCIRTLKDF